MVDDIQQAYLEAKQLILVEEREEIQRDIRFAALDLSIMSFSPVGAPSAEVIMNRAKIFENYIKGDSNE